MNKEKEQTNGERFEEFMRTVEGYPELEGTMNLCNDIIEKRAGKMTEEEWQAAERAQIVPKQETLEEAALKYLKSKCVKMYPEEVRLFVAGAKWQAEQTISDEEIEKSAKEYDIKSTRWGAKTIFIDAIKWYKEQLKNK